MPTYTELVAQAEENARDKAIAEIRAGGVGGLQAKQQPTESQADWKKRTQAEVDAGTYVPPTAKSSFGVDAANTAIDIGRKFVSGIFANPITDAKPPTPIAAPASATVAVNKTPEQLKAEAKAAVASAFAATPETKPAAAAAPVSATPADNFIYPEKYPKPSGEDYHTYASKLPEDQFMEFATKNADNPNFQGVGYVFMNDDGTGKKRLEKIISRPDQKNPNEALHETLSTILTAITGKTKAGRADTWNKGVRIPGVSKEELAAVSNITGHLGVGEDKKEIAQERFAYNKERLDELKLQHAAINAHNTATLKQLEIAGQDTRDIKKTIASEDSFQKDLTTFGMDKNTGEFNSEKGLFEMAAIGRHVDRPEVQRVYTPFQVAKSELEKKKGAPLTPAEILKLKSNYYKAKGWAAQ